MTLRELTGHSCGIMIYRREGQDDTVVVVSNWDTCGEDELPMVFSLVGTVMPWRVDGIFKDVIEKETDSVRDLVAGYADGQEEDGRCCYGFVHDPWGHLAQFFEDADRKAPGRYYRLADGSVAVVPEGWD